MLRLMHGLNGWTFVLGEVLSRGSLIALHGNGFFYESRQGAVNAARKCGLVVDRRGIVTAANASQGAL